MLTLMLIVLLKIDLTKEDIPGAEDTVGVVLLFANTIPTAASLVLSLLSQPDARDGMKTWKGAKDEEDEADETDVADEADKKDKKGKKDKKDKKGKKDKKDKQEVGRTGLTPPCLLRVRDHCTCGSSSLA